MLHPFELFIFSLPGSVGGPAMNLIPDLSDEGGVVGDGSAVDTSCFLVAKDAVGFSFGNGVGETV